MRNNKGLSKTEIWAIIPAYNEAQAIGEVIRSLKSYVGNIIVINDCSTDETASVAKKTGAKTVLNHPINLGQGAALQTGFNYVKQFEPKVVVTYDADGQFEPKEIPKIVAPIFKKKAEVVLGSRFLGKTQNMPKSRQILLKAAIVFTKVFSNLELTDVHNGFRALSPKAINQINLKHNRMTHASEILDQINQFKLSYVEVPVTVKYTDYSLKKGQNNFNSIKIIRDLILTKLT